MKNYLMGTVFGALVVSLCVSLGLNCFLLSIVDEHVVLRAAPKDTQPELAPGATASLYTASADTISPAPAPAYPVDQVTVATTPAPAYPVDQFVVTSTQPYAPPLVVPMGFTPPPVPVPYVTGGPTALTVSPPLPAPSCQATVTYSLGQTGAQTTTFPVPFVQFTPAQPCPNQAGLAAPLSPASQIFAATIPATSAQPSSPCPVGICSVGGPCPASVCATGACPATGSCTITGTLANTGSCPTSGATAACPATSCPTGACPTATCPTTACPTTGCAQAASTFRLITGATFCPASGCQAASVANLANFSATSAKAKPTDADLAAKLEKCLQRLAELEKKLLETQQPTVPYSYN